VVKSCNIFRLSYLKDTYLDIEKRLEGQVKLSLLFKSFSLHISSNNLVTKMNVRICILIIQS